MKYDDLDRVRRIAALYTTQKTSDLLEGDFSSLQHGRSLDFDDLREYRYGDEISDIDWKSSSRTGKTLVRRYFADRKHDVLFVCDTGSKMKGDTPAGESKENLAMMVFGVSAYLFDKQGVNFAMAFSGTKGDVLFGFRSGASHLEKLMAEYRRAVVEGEPKHLLRDVLENASTAFARRLVMVIITDGEGMAGIDGRLIRRAVSRNDVYVFKIEDAFLTTPGVFDLQADRFEDPFLAMNAKLHREEIAMRRGMDEQAERLMTPSRVFFRGISREEEIVDALAELFHRRRRSVIP